MKTFEKAAPKGAAPAGQWTDLYVRTDFGDTGAYPEARNTFDSPDIIALGSDECADPDELISDSSWNTYADVPTDPDEENYIYVRGANLDASKRRTGRAYLYYCTPSLILWPSLWSKNDIATSGGKPYAEIAADAQQRFVTSDPFLRAPVAIENQRYSLVTRIETTENPNPIPPDGDIYNFLSYVSNHPNVGWSNAVVFDPSDSNVIASVRYDQGPTGSFVYMNVKCVNCPDDSLISMDCETPGPKPPIYYAPTAIKNPKGGDTFIITLYTYIEADWGGTITMKWQGNGREPLPGMRIELAPIVPVDPELQSSLATHARPLEEFGITIASPNGPRKGLRLGQFTVRASQSATR